MAPGWLHALFFGFSGPLCAAAIAIDVFRHPRNMWMMNVVWPVFALFGGVVTLWVTNSFKFWFMMQIAMICGFITSYPINSLLIRSGIKEAM